MYVVDAIAQRLKDLYKTSLSTLCPLPWVEEVPEIIFDFDEMFIPLRVTTSDPKNKHTNG